GRDGCLRRCDRVCGGRHIRGRQRDLRRRGLRRDDRRDARGRDGRAQPRMISEAEFRAFAAQGFNRIPMVLESFADLDTPLSLYLKLANQRYTFLLESVVGGERFGRYSFIGLPAKVRIRAHGRRVEVEDRGGIIERFDGDPFSFLREYLQRYRAAPLPGLPRFCGGLAGYFGYDTV